MTKAEKTRQWIIEQAAPIFNKKGVAGTAMSDIMEATKLSKGSLYVHFEDKDELSLCVVDHTLGTLFAKAAAAVGKHSSAKGKVMAFIDFLSDPLHPPVTGGCPMQNFGNEADDTNPAILKKVESAMKKTQQHIAAIIEQGIRAGEFKKEWNAKEFATKAFALIEGGILISRVSGKSNQMKVIVKMIKTEIEENSI